MDEEEFEGNMIWIVRFEAWKRTMRPTPCTRPDHEIEVIDYCHRLIGQHCRNNVYQQYEVELIEFDEVVTVNAYIPKGVIDDFGYFLNRAQGKYLYMPQGHSEGFGFYSDNCAWLYPHPTMPVVFFRNDKNRVLHWMNRYRDVEFNMEFPDKDEIQWVVPEEFKPKERRVLRGRRII